MGAANTNLDQWMFLGGAGFIFIGLVVALIALFRDRSRKRPRCPKCWYDMTGAPTLKCPECGRDARREKRLFKTRRHWGWAVVGFVFMLAGAGSISPWLKRIDWPRYLPSAVLVRVAPADGSMWNGDSFRNMIARMQLPPAMANSYMSKVSTSQELNQEAWDRVLEGKTSPAQARTWIERWLQENKAVPEGTVWLPERWIAGLPIPVFASKADWWRHCGALELEFTGPHNEGSWRSPVLAGPVAAWAAPLAAGHQKMELTWKMFCGAAAPRVSHTLFLPIEIVAEESFFESVASSTANDAVKAAIDPRVTAEKDGLWIVLNDRAPTAGWNAVDFSVAVRVGILIDGRQICQGTATVCTSATAGSPKRYVRDAAWDSAAQEILANAMDRARFVVESDVRAGRDAFVQGYPNRLRPAVWAGRFECPVRVENRPTSTK